MTFLMLTVCLIVGVILPMTLIILLGALYLVGGNPVHVFLSLTIGNFVPRLNSIGNIVLLVGFMLAFTGIEASANHASQVRNPRRDYPTAILLVVLISMVLYIAGALSIAMVMPQKDISLLAGLAGMTEYLAFAMWVHLRHGPKNGTLYGLLRDPAGSRFMAISHRQGGSAEICQISASRQRRNENTRRSTRNWCPSLWASSPRSLSCPADRLGCGTGPISR